MFFIPCFLGGATAFSLFPDLGRRPGYDGFSVFSGPRPQVPMPPSSMISPLPMRPTFNGTGFPGSSKLQDNPMGTQWSARLDHNQEIVGHLTRISRFEMLVEGNFKCPTMEKPSLGGYVQNKLA